MLAGSLIKIGLRGKQRRPTINPVALYPAAIYPAAIYLAAIIDTIAAV